MVFSSLIFIFRFMPIFFLLYYLLPFKWKNTVLFFGSLIFYAWGEPRYCILVLASILVNFFLAKGIDRSEDGGSVRLFLFILAVIYNIGMLVVFKYTGFIMENINAIFKLNLPVPEIPLPLGISFYTFQILSYIIDVYRYECFAEKSILGLGTYLIMFPQLVAGPIVIYGRVADALRRRRISLRGLENGLKTFTLGLASKVILANNLGNIWNACGEAGYSNISTPFAWLGSLSYTLQLYFDFNGYSLMAVGLGEMLGFRFPLNFKYPYIARSVTDFWRRWHITLTSWFRKYVYIPLGGNRCSLGRTLINMLVVWLITGLWHGAAWNFIIWGLAYFVILVFERIFLKELLSHLQVISRIYTMLIVMCGWVLFAAPSLGDALVYFSRMFTWHGGQDFQEYLHSYWPLLLAGCFFSTPILSRLYHRHHRSIPVLVALFVLFWASIVMLVDSVYNPFLYFRF